jgi:hypothetical protein
MLRLGRSLSKVVTIRAVRGMAHAAPAAHTPKTDIKVPDGVHVPEIVEDLTFLLDMPCNQHEFDEPPVFIIFLNYTIS